MDLPMTRLRCAILDDYLNLALGIADWSKISDRVDVTVFNEPFASGEAAASALANGRPFLSVAHCVRDGLVRTYDVLALPTSSRWGGTLIGAYVNERATQYNLLDAIFSTTDEGVLSFATIRDSSGQPFDFQIIHHNQGASRLLKLPSSELQWRRLSAGGHLLCLPEVIERLLGVIRSGNRDQFEIDSDDRNLNWAPPHSATFSR